MKSLLGKSSWEYADNIKRNEYNKKIKGMYEKNTIFDLSYYEALNQDKTEETFKENGNTYYAMSHAYTNDGGHLNKKGQKWIAENFLNFLWHGNCFVAAHGGAVKQYVCQFPGYSSSSSVNSSGCSCCLIT